MALGHAVQTLGQQRRILGPEPQQRLTGLRSPQVHPIQDAPIQGLLARIVDLAGKGHEHIAAAEMVRPAAHAIRLPAAAEEGYLVNLAVPVVPGQSRMGTGYNRGAQEGHAESPWLSQSEGGAIAVHVRFRISVPDGKYIVAASGMLGGRSQRSVVPRPR